MNKKIHIAKNMMIVAALVFGVVVCASCASTSMADMYDNDSKIAGNSNSYNLKNCEQHIDGQNYQCRIEKLEGMDTVWTYDAAEDVSAELSYSVSVYNGKMKLVLIAPDDSLTTIAEITAETASEASQKHTVHLKKGKNRIKVVAAKDTKLDIELSIPIGEFEELGF